MLTMMVSEREDYRLKCVYLLPAGGRQVGQHCEGNSLITQTSNNGTDKQLQQLHTFTKKKKIHTFPTRQQMSQVSNHIAIYLDSTKIRQMIKFIYRYTDHANYSCRREHGDTKFVRPTPHYLLLLFVSNNNYIFAIHWSTIEWNDISITVSNKTFMQHLDTIFTEVEKSANSSNQR